MWQEAVVKTQSLIHPDNLYAAAAVASIAGNREQALGFLQQIIDQPNVTFDWSQLDPCLAWMRADSRFEELMGKIIDKKDIGTDELGQAEGEKQVAVVETKSANKM